MDLTYSDADSSPLNGGAWMPAKIDWSARSVNFRKIDPDAFSSAPFHDGRHEFMTGSPKTLNFDALIQYEQSREAIHPDRFVLHPSFCGSTFLAKLLSVHGKTNCYREPQVLIELADGSADPQAREVNAAIIQQLRQAPQETAAAFCKPSNWANEYLLKSGALDTARLVIITIDLQSFLIANLRGGNDRIRYSLNLLNHIMPYAPHHLAHAKEAQTLLSTSPMAATLRLMTILHKIQFDSFEATQTRTDNKAKLIKHSDIKTRPVETAWAASQWLALGLSETDISHQFKTHSQQHAKSLKPQTFSTAKEETANTSILTQFSDDIQKTLVWAESL
ncbi:MAG: hypothetical protein ACSHXY_12425 [Alphaproteobacteria bacterium]